MNKIKNFARFYVLVKRIPNFDEQMKEEYVAEFTDGRTKSLHDIRPNEYKRLCDAIEAATLGTSETHFQTELKSLRSAVLKRMQRQGIDTADWDKVDAYCLQSRIAGKVFRQLSIEDLRALIKKLEAIARKKPKSDFIVLPTPVPGVMEEKPGPDMLYLSDRDVENLIHHMSTQIPN